MALTELTPFNGRELRGVVARPPYISPTPLRFYAVGRRQKSRPAPASSYSPDVSLCPIRLIGGRRDGRRPGARPKSRAICPRAARWRVPVPVLPDLSVHKHATDSRIVRGLVVEIHFQFHNLAPRKLLCRPKRVRGLLERYSNPFQKVSCSIQFVTPRRIKPIFLVRKKSDDLEK